MKRRTFLRSSLAAGTATLILPTGLLSGPSKNETLQVALIGSGRMGLINMKQALGLGSKAEVNARIVAVCDVDSKRAANAKSTVEKYYREKGEGNIDVKTYGDFRDVLARSDIDAVIVATPENWHGLIGIAAANAGKHIYLQKPLTYSIPEGKALVAAVRANNVVLQTGSQQRSSVYFRQVCTIIRNNWLGELKTIEVEVPTDKGRADFTAMDVPQSLNYDSWLGPCEDAPYTEVGVHPQNGLGRPGWLQVERYCLGMITGWGSHMYDIAQWGMGTDHDSGPVEISATGDFPDRGIFNVHVGYQGEALYKNGVRMISRNGNPGVKFITENGWAHCSRGGFKCSNKELLRRKPQDNEVSLYQSSNHMTDFLTSVRSGKDPICPVEVGHRSNSICVLHHLSMKLGGRKINWDPTTQTPVGDDEVSSMLNVPMHAPWTI
jgi:myo-inositol 2-dehydrogenase/D-chiro-inositol 1-dehydrogenase